MFFLIWCGLIALQIFLCFLVNSAIYTWSKFCFSLIGKIVKCRSCLVQITWGESSRTHFEVLGLEASSPRKLPFPRLEDSTIFKNAKILLTAWKKILKNEFSGARLKNVVEDLFFRRTLAACVLGLSLVHSSPWPGEGLCSEELFLAWASEFFCVLGREPCVLDSASANYLLFYRHKSQKCGICVVFCKFDSAN